MCRARMKFLSAHDNDRPIPTNVFMKLKCREKKWNTKEPRMNRNFSKFHQLILALLRVRVCTADVRNDSLSCCVWNVWTIDERPFISVRIIPLQTAFLDKCFLEFQLRFSKMSSAIAQRWRDEGKVLRCERQKGWIAEASRRKCHKNLLIGKCKKVKTHKIKSTCQRFD
jgi:hypothetical protein